MVSGSFEDLRGKPFHLKSFKSILFFSSNSSAFNASHFLSSCSSFSCCRIFCRSSELVAAGVFCRRTGCRLVTVGLAEETVLVVTRFSLVRLEYLFDSAGFAG